MENTWKAFTWGSGNEVRSTYTRFPNKRVPTKREFTVDETEDHINIRIM